MPYCRVPVCKEITHEQRARTRTFVPMIVDGAAQARRVGVVLVHVCSRCILAVVQTILALLALVVVSRDRRPSSARAWILPIILFPLIGALFLLVIGSAKLPRKRQAMQRSMNERIEERASAITEVRAEHPARRGCRRRRGGTRRWGRCRCWRTSKGRWLR